MNFDMKKFYVILLFSVVLFASVSATWATDINNDLDDVDILSNDLENNEIADINENKSFEDIQTLIDNANENDTIDLDGTYLGSGKEIIVNKTLTVDGHGATLDAKKSSRIFNVISSNCIFKNINFINGDTLRNGDGGAILFNNIGYVYNCTFMNNSAPYGGSVYGGYIFTSSFINNGASFGGALAYSKVSKSTFKNNSAATGKDLFNGWAYNCINENGSDISCGGQDCDIGNYTYIIFVEDESVYVTEEAYITAQLFDENGTPLSNKILNLFLFDCVLNATTNEKGIVIFNCSEFTDEAVEDCPPVGYVKLAENNLSNNASFVLFINKYPSYITIDNVKGNFSKYIDINATIKDNKDNLISYGTVEFIIAGEFIESEVNNGKATFRYYCEDVGKYDIFASFSNNDKFANSDCEYILTVDKLFTTLSVSTTGTAYKATKLKVVLANCNVDIVPVTLTFSNGKKVTLNLNEGVGYYNIPYAPGKYNVTVSINNVLFKANSVTKSFTISKASGAIITPTKLTTTYNSGKYFQIKVTHSGVAMVGVKLALKVYTGKNYKTVYVTTGSNGIAKYSASKLSIGTHKIIVSSAESTSYMTASKKTNYVVIKKATTTVSAPKVTNKYYSNKYFKVTIKNKATGKVISGLKIKIKVYTGKKYKTYTVKTNTKGVASLSTKYIKKGTHKVVISSANAKYTVSKSGYLIKIY